MNRTEAATVLDNLMAGYPWADLDVAVRRNWVEAIEDSGAETEKANEIARRWPRTHERFPSLAEFLSIITPRPYPEPVHDPDDLRPAPPVVRQLASRWRNALAETDEKIAQIGARRGVAGHWHGGPDNCPLCGGAPRIGQ